MQLSLKKFKPITIFILADVQADDLIYRFVALGAGKRLSPLFMNKGESHRISGNPYSVYGDEIKKYYKFESFDLVSLRVCQFTSGHLVD